MWHAPAFGAALAVLLLAQTAHGCVNVMHAAPRRLNEARATPWDYNLRGDDWLKGKDAKGMEWICATGKRQSPIRLNDPADLTKNPTDLMTTWHYKPITSNGKNVQIYNNGHTIQIQWSAGALESSVEIPAHGDTILDVLKAKPEDAGKFKSVKAKPVQFHFHVQSEHTLAGVQYPLEMHIVHNIPQSELAKCPDAGCTTVTTVLLQLDPKDKDNEALNVIFDNMPFLGGEMTELPSGQTLDIEALLPKNREYAEYSGSLSTPPCTEGILWQVFTEPIYVSFNQVKQYSLAMAPKECENADGFEHWAQRRMLLTDGAQTGSFVKGSYSGFRRATLMENTATRNLLQDNPNCTAEAYGVTYRNTQDLNGRDVYLVSA